MTVRELIAALEAHLATVAETYDELDPKVFGANTAFQGGDLGIQWFDITGILDVHDPQGGVLVEIAPMGASGDQPAKPGQPCPWLS